MTRLAARRQGQVRGMVLLVAVASGLAIVAGPASTREAQAQHGLTRAVHTDAGSVRGLARDDHVAFRGIPYAAPPVGRLRWQPPQPVTPWPGVRHSVDSGPGCLAESTPAAAPARSEDCLSLDVVAPRAALAGEKRPVMVYIGGGTSAASDFNSSRLAVQGNVVVVTINYRLGVFGFLGHPGLSDSGTYGTQDQQAALGWVQRNIAAFGGDGDKVTVFGESAGGVSICNQLVSPAAHGLFHRAAMQSGTCGTYYLANSQFSGHPNMPLWRNRPDSEHTGRRTAQALGCDRTRLDNELRCLRETPAGELQAQPGPFLPTYGTRVLPEEPSRALRVGHFNKVPVLNGTTRDEGRFFARGLPSDMTADQYRALLRAAFGDDAGAVESRYPTGHDPRLAWAQVMTDRTFTVPTMDTNAALARHVPTYGFEFRDRRAPNYLDVPTGGMPLGAYHSADVPYLVDVTGAPATFTPEQQHLSDRMIGYWTQFATNGSPNGVGLPGWPSFDATSRIPRVQGLAPEPEGMGPVNYGAEHQLAFWNSVS